MPQSRTPALKPADFHVLLALAGAERHGYGLVEDIEEQSGGRLRLVPGSLYAVLRRLQGWGWVEESGVEREDSGGPPRRLYRITARGSRVLEAEVERMREVLQTVEARQARQSAVRGTS